MPWTLDTNHSAISWENLHLGISLIRGRFNTFQADVTLDETDLEKSSVVATIAAASIDSGNERRDDTLRGPVYLDVEHHPSAEFRSTRIEKRGEGYAIHGDLTLRNVTRPVTLSATFNGQARSQRGATIRGFSAHTTIRRSDFGISTSWVETTFMAGDAIKLLLEIELTLKD